MVNYKKKYRDLFVAITKANLILQEAQQKCEQMYIEAEEKEDFIKLLNKSDKTD